MRIRIIGAASGVRPLWVGVNCSCVWSARAESVRSNEAPGAIRKCTSTSSKGTNLFRGRINNHAII